MWTVSVEAAQSELFRFEIAFNSGTFSLRTSSAFRLQTGCTQLDKSVRKRHWRRYLSSFSFEFSRQGSQQWILLLQLFLSSVSSYVISTSAMSSFTTTINLLFGLHRFMFPGNSIQSILLPISPSSFLRRSLMPFFSPPIPSCLYSLLRFSSVLSITLCC